MKTLAIITIMLLSLTAFGQKTRIVKVYSCPQFTINSYIEYDEMNTPIDTSYHMSGSNAKYTHISDMVTISNGSLLDMKLLFEKCLLAFDEDFDTFLHIGDNMIYVGKYMNVAKVIHIHGIDSDASGYIILSKDIVKKTITKLNAITATKTAKS